jgi:hypothetical protein
VAAPLAGAARSRSITERLQVVAPICVSETFHNRRGLLLGQAPSGAGEERQAPESLVQADEVQDHDTSALSRYEMNQNVRC